MRYVDGFVIPVPTANKNDFLAMAAKVAPLFREYGALRVVECWGDDVPPGTTTDFPMAVKAEPTETVVFSWIEWPSKAVRDEAMAKIRNDPRAMRPSDPMPFDARRMIFGGFAPILDTAES